MGRDMSGSRTANADRLLDRWPTLTLVMIGFVWLTHGLMFFAHEYAHSFTAWALGWKINPLLLNFGNFDALNLITQLEIGEKVNYGPIFAAGRGAEAALIAVAGVLFGNAVPFVALAWLTRRASRSGHRLRLLFLYLLCVMGVGNFIDYVPIRIFAPIDDMHTTEVGLGWSPWLLLAVLGVPFAIGGWYLFRRLLPKLSPIIFPGQRRPQAALALTSTFLVFVFFGAAGLESGVGVISQRLSYVSVLVLFPLMSVLCWPRRDAESEPRP
jgi:hypothetical protein